MGDKGRKDKNKHDKQANKAKNAKNEANRKKQEKAHQQSGPGTTRDVSQTKPRVGTYAYLRTSENKNLLDE